MKIICDSQLGTDTKILTDDGKDITKELKITDITIVIECGELIKAKIECIPNSIQIQKIEQFLLSDNENKEYQIIPKIKL